MNGYTGGYNMAQFTDDASIVAKVKTGRRDTPYNNFINVSNILGSTEPTDLVQD